jgi:hypothetical protein
LRVAWEWLLVAEVDKENGYWMHAVALVAEVEKKSGYWLR